MAISWKIVASNILLIAVTACWKQPNTLPFGYYLIDGGGSKLSLARPDGTIVISYSVSGVINIKDGVIVQYKEYNDGDCSYLKLSNLPNGINETVLNKPYSVNSTSNGRIVGLTKLTPRSCDFLTVR